MARIDLGKVVGGGGADISIATKTSAGKVRGGGEIQVNQNTGDMYISNEFQELSSDAADIKIKKTDSYGVILSKISKAIAFLEIIRTKYFNKDNISNILTNDRSKVPSLSLLYDINNNLVNSAAEAKTVRIIPERKEMRELDMEHHFLVDGVVKVDTTIGGDSGEFLIETKVFEFGGMSDKFIRQFAYVIGKEGYFVPHIYYRNSVKTSSGWSINEIEWKRIRLEDSHY